MLLFTLFVCTCLVECCGSHLQYHQNGIFGEFDHHHENKLNDLPQALLLNQTKYPSGFEFDLDRIIEHQYESYLEPKSNNENYYTNDNYKTSNSFGLNDDVYSQKFHPNDIEIDLYRDKEYDYMSQYENDALNYFRLGNKEPVTRQSKGKTKQGKTSRGKTPRGKVTISQTPRAQTKSTTEQKRWQTYTYKRKQKYNYSESSQCVTGFTVVDYGVLPEYEVDAFRTQENKYPWIARVVHSRTKPYPHIATAACIDNRIFITAARSVYNLKVQFTSIVYSGKQLPVISIILPSSPSKQHFDDIGILVVKYGLIDKWSVIKIFDKPRTDTNFNWFEDLKLDNSVGHKAIGFAINKKFSKVATVYSKYELVEMDVYLGIEICVTTYSVWDKIPGTFHVPCYYACTSKEFFNVVNSSIKANKCQKYLGVEGAVVFNSKTKTLMGVATWGESPFPKFNFALAVGVAVPNSKSFLEDYACAKKIRNDKTKAATSGYFQKLCQ